MVERALGRIAGFSVGHPRLVLALAAVATAVALLAAAERLSLRTSNLDLIDPELPTVSDFREFATEFGTPNVLVVVLEGAGERRLARAVDRVAPRLATVAGVRAVIDRRPYDEEAVEALGLDPYFASRDRTLFFVFVQPEDSHSSAETIEPLVVGVREALAASGVATGGVRVGLTGIPVYALDDRDVIRGDIARLSVVSGLLVLALFVAAFRSLRRPAAAVAALVAAIALTVGVVALWPGHLTLLSAFFASILFGLGIDFGIHVVGRVEELTAEGLDETSAIPRAVGSLARGLVAGALTTAGVFFGMLLSGFLGFAELGFISGAGVIVCLLTTVTVLPALLVTLRRRPARPPDRRPGNRIGDLLLGLRRSGLAWLVGGAALAAPLVGPPAFDTDYLALQPADSDAVRLEREMVRRSDFSPQFAAFVAPSKPAALALADRLMADETVGAVRSIADVEPPVARGQASRPAPELVAAFRSARGRHAVYAYPLEDIWNPVEQRRFLEHMRAIDERVTGMPVLGSFMVERSRRAMHRAAALGAIILPVVVWTVFRRLRLALLALLPTALTASSLLALMRLGGVDFNPLNVMALPVVLGVAVDDGIHMVHRFVVERGDLGRTLAGTGRTVVLTSLTTLAAFGTLAATSHRGLASFAIALSLGVGAALVYSVVVLPAMLERFGALGPARGAARLRRREPASAAGRR